MPDKNDQLFLPGILDPTPAPWTVQEVKIRESAVNLTKRVAYVPRALTPAQRLARLHEAAHVKHTPRNWNKHMAAVLAELDEVLDPKVVIDISMMLEENRIDWILWDRYIDPETGLGVDLRPAREVLDWSKMPVPEEPLRALKWVLQLAWTVWASKGLHASVPNRPPEREPDAACSEFFDACWAVVADHHVDLPAAVVRGCLAIYGDPSHRTRNSVAAELATFFPPKVEKEEQPDEKPEEKKAQEEAEKEAEREEKSREKAEEKAEEAEPKEAEKVPDPKTGRMYMDVHDHTGNIRRRSTKIRRKLTPTWSGSSLRFPHRYMLDKAIFALRTVTEGGLMIDMSSSMRWSDRDLRATIEILPSITVGGYGGFNHPGTRTYAHIPSHYPGTPEGGRICIFAKAGKFCPFHGRDPGFSGGNSIDVEALQMLAKWPKPRFWLSDGLVCGGQYQGPHPDKSWNTTDFMESDGNVTYECARLMRRYEIHRIPNVATLHDLLKRKRVTLFSTPVNHRDGRGYWFPYHIEESPVRFQL